MSQIHKPQSRLLEPVLLILLLGFSELPQDADSELLPPGFRPVPLGVHALVGAKLIVKPGETLDPATIIIRDGFIQAIGANVAVPSDARVWDMKGLTIYAGFIDPYLTLDAKIGDKPAKKELDLTPGGVKFFRVGGEQAPGPSYHSPPFP